MNNSWIIRGNSCLKIILFDLLRFCWISLTEVRVWRCNAEAQPVLARLQSVKLQRNCVNITLFSLININGV